MQPQEITIVMYHYVRDLQRSRFPAINGLSTERFCNQLDYIVRYYTPISIETLFNAIDNGSGDLPANPVLLTFDDGYSDHFETVFPLLAARHIQGCFFPPAQAILEHTVLDVNKIHFVLASVLDPTSLLDDVFSMLTELYSEASLKDKEDYLRTPAAQHRYDYPAVAAVKRLLQRDLPAIVRREVVRRLFVKYVTSDEAAFACELYMSFEQIACLRGAGMHVGSHGYSHSWLNHLSPHEQASEVDLSFGFLTRLNIRREEWTICYPYGGVDESLLQILRGRECRVGFTAEPRLADLTLDSPLTLPRIDTNDLPS